VKKERIRKGFGTTSGSEKRKRKTDTLSFELEAKVLLEPGRNSRWAFAKRPKKAARKQERTKGDCNLTLTRST